MKQKIVYFIKNEIVLIVAAAFAAASMCLVPPSKAYVKYFDFSVLALLFSLMAVVNGFQKNGVLHQLAQSLLSHTRDMRNLSRVLVLLCFFSSMLITNDVALLTFVPFSVLVLTYTKQKKYLVYVVVLQTIAANLGSMLTPIGNPQNLYLYRYFDLKAVDFIAMTFPITVVSLLLMLFACQLVKKDQIEVVFSEESVLKNPGIIIGYVILFSLCLLAVLHVVHYAIVLAIVCLFLLFIDRNGFQMIDYCLLFTFMCFFIFVGNLGQMYQLCRTMTQLLQGREQLMAVAISQIISNVPAAVLLSGFTHNAKALVVGTNIGGLGTLVASLASLISFKLYAKIEQAKPMQYLITFTGMNVFFLTALLMVF